MRQIRTLTLLSGEPLVLRLPSDSSVCCSRVEAVRRGEEVGQARPTLCCVQEGLQEGVKDDVYVVLNIYCIVLMTWFNYYSHSSKDSYNDSSSRASILMNTGACVGGTIIAWLSQFVRRRRAIVAAAIISCCMIPAWILPTNTIERSLSASCFFTQFFIQGAWGVILIHMFSITPSSTQQRKSDSGLVEVYHGYLYRYYCLGIAVATATFFSLGLHPGKRLLLWKADVMGAFRTIPVHPLWQLKQVVTSMVGESKTDKTACVGLVDDMTWYDPYEQFYPTDQVRLLDSTLPDDSKSDLIRHVYQFAHVARRRQTLHDFEQLTGWINWSLNVYPLLKPALSNIYAKMSGKERSHAPIYLNKAIVQDLAWFEEHVEASSGIGEHGDLLRRVSDSMGFWVPEMDLGFTCAVAGDLMRDKIFFWEALCVLGALVWYEQSNLAFFATPECPARLTIFTDNTNTVNIFDTLRALPDYNPILKAAVDIRIRSNIDLRVVHISGELNTVADALSRDYLDVVQSLVPNLYIDTFKPPRLTLGATQK
ncbi:hypothetical protein BDZ89DRAFT_1261324 [Hymenopellis radicata]|nr:hypothetical protein BDZ89DRAFT_1261324 [Hymenopellis radicata]